MSPEQREIHVKYGHLSALKGWPKRWCLIRRRRGWLIEVTTNEAHDDFKPLDRMKPLPPTKFCAWLDAQIAEAKRAEGTPTHGQRP